MKGLEGARVVVLDDKVEEALPVLYALASMGIAAAFFNPDHGVRSFPSEPLKGVRLAILDMDLVGGGADSKTKVSALMGAINRILSPSNGPYSVLVWTMHPDLQEHFERALFTSEQTPRPLSVLSIRKDEVGLDGELNADLLFDKVMESLSVFSPLVILESWERDCHKAASDVLHSLSELVQPTTTDPGEWRRTWAEDSLQVMKVLAEGEAGKTLKDDICLSSLYTALNPLFVDRLEVATTVTPPDPDLAIPVMKAGGALSSDRRARINTMVHLAHDQLQRISAGNIYLFAVSDKAPTEIPSFNSVLADMAVNEPSPDLATRFAQETRLVAIEISPRCDHAQKKLRSLRLVVGLLIPEGLRDHFKASNRDMSFLWELGPVYIDAGPLHGAYHLLLSARFQANTALEALSHGEAFARLRTQALSNLQFWVSFYTSRPAMSEL